MNTGKKYMNPYLAGFGIGIVLLLSFLIAGRGLGASGSVNHILAKSYENAGIENNYLHNYSQESSLLNIWIILEVMGLFTGAFISAKLSKRIKKETIKGKNTSNKRRYIMAVSGGILMGFASRLARGCTSGQALSGGAILSLGSWIFMVSIFLGAYLLINFLRKDWQ